jgi:hypothetical protein
MGAKYVTILSRGFIPLVLIVALVLVLSGCEKLEDATLNQSPTATSQTTVTLGKSDSRVGAAILVQERHTSKLMSTPDVVGTAVGLDNAGDVVVKVYTVREGVGNLPATLDGMKVDVEVTGVIHAMGKPGKVSHTAKQTPPIQLGTSGGWRYDLANGYCCGGTLGSLVKIGNTQYILSNYHVFRSDIVSGGNSRVATNGDPIVQPGLIDVSCNAANAQNVATLAGSASLPGSNVDAAIAQVISGMVRTDGAILEIGTISSQTVAASLGQLVKKSGRTTGLTRSKVSGLNATVSVAYDNECAGGAAFTKTFTGQIVISNKGSSFLNSGDSGSLMVEDVTTNPRAVGLLFAGSSSTAIANPIGQVLTLFGATMVGN